MNCYGCRDERTAPYAVASVLRQLSARIEHRDRES